MDLARLTRADVAAYRSLMLAAYASEPVAFTSTVTEREALPASWWASRVERHAIYGAFVSDDLVGVAGLRRSVGAKTSHKSTLFGMFVAPSSRGRGVGRALVEAVLDHARRAPSLRIVQLSVTASNHAAVSLYEACGFVGYGSEPFAVRTDDGYVTKRHMWLDLTERGA